MRGPAGPQFLLCMGLFSGFVFREPLVYGNTGRPLRMNHMTPVSVTTDVRALCCRAIRTTFSADGSNSRSWIAVWLGYRTK